MNGILRNKVALCVLGLIAILTGFTFADDVTVQDGSMYIDNDLSVLGISSHHIDTVNLSADHADLNDTEINDGLLIDNGLDIYCDNWGYAYFDAIGFNFGDLFYIDGGSSTFVAADCDFIVNGKIDSSGGYDPPYVLYDQQSREEVIDKVKKEVSPEKQSGAALFFNKENKRLETYVASEGKFYDLEGNLIHELAKIVEPTIKYETVYHFDSTTGEARPILRPIRENYQIKEGYALDKRTGGFIKKDTNQVVSREEALEIYVASEGKVYDLQHNFIRNAENKQSEEVASAGNQVNSPSKINTAQNNAENQEIQIKPVSLNN